jgi:gliding motility-associated-like protein
VYCLVDVSSAGTPSCTQVLTACATIIVDPLPTATITTNTICENTTGTVTITGTPDATVQYTVDSGANQAVVLDATGTATIISPVLTVDSMYCLVDVSSAGTPSCTQVLTACATVIVISLPTVSLTGDTICDGDTALVNFTGTPGATVNYTLNGVAQTPITLSPTGTAAVSATVAGTYDIVDVTSNTTPACTQVVVATADVVVLTSPVVNPITELHVCDDNNDGFAIFDLTNAVAEAQGTDLTLIVTIHETQADADFPSNALTAAEIVSYQNIVPNTQVLYIRIENAGGCYSTTTFAIIIDTRPSLNQNVSDYELCDVNNSPDGIEVFDLTNATTTADITNGVAGLTLTYYENQADAVANNTANAIPNTTTYSNILSPNQQTIWVVGQSAAGCTHITSFELIVNPLPPITPLLDMNGCSDGVNLSQAPFDLTFNDSVVTGGAPGYTVTYHELQTEAESGINALSSPYTGTDGQIVIVRVVDNDTGCYDTTTVQLNVTQGPVANTPTPLTYCDPNNDGFGLFNLLDALNDISGGPTPPGVVVTFHETPQDAQQGTNAIDTTILLYDNIVADQQTIYVSVSYASTGCANYTELLLIVNPTPEIVSPANPISECDDAVPDGVTQFDLTQVETEVLNGIDPTTVTITYYLTQGAADAGTPNITNSTNYTNTSNPQTIYIRVEYNATGCYSVESFELVVNSLPILPAPEDITMSLCDVTNSGDQIECFDLMSQIPLIVNGQTDMHVTFHFSQADAIAGVSPLASPYCNTSNAQSIFVRLENEQTDCFDTVIMDLRVEPLPLLVVPDPVEECDADGDGFATFDLTALETAMLNGATGITLSYYETQTDAQNQVNQITNTTAYQNIDPFNQIIYVRADNDLTGCFTIEQIQLIVHPSPIMPTLDNLVICDTNYDGHAYFNFSQQSQLIWAANTMPEAQLPIRYYTTALNAANGTSAIVTTNSYYNATNPQTIWVVVRDIVTGCSATTTFDLIVNLPVNVSGQDNELTLCDDGLPNDQFATFDLTVMYNQIAGTSGATLTYYPSITDAQNGTNEITTPTAYANVDTSPAVQTLGVVVTSVDGCEIITTLTIRVEPLPTPNQGPYLAIEVCDDDQTMIGTELFDLTINQTTIQDGYPNLTFTYYANQDDYDDGIVILDPTAYEGPTSTIVIAVQNDRVDFFGENCVVLVYQPIQVNPLPVVADTTYVLCDDDTDGFATFDLQKINYLEALLGTTQSPADFTVTYYDTQANAEATTTTGLLPNMYTNTTNPEVIYPRVINNTTGCVSALAEVTLMVKLKAIANPISQAILDTFTKCDYYGANDGEEQFDLTDVESDLLGAQTSPPISITYHLNPADQATGDNPIANMASFENTSNPQMIYIRVTRANDDPLDTTEECYDVAEITLNVELLAEPVITSSTGYNIICVAYPSEDLITGLTLDSGIPAGSGYTHQWALNGADITDGTATGATYTITTAAPGTYSVVATSTSAQGCVSLPAEFTVIQSGPATNIQSFISGSFEEIQTITITNDGYGTYEYQLDGEGPWQSSPIFTNVPAGTHFVVVRDATNPDYRCDEMRIDNVSIINYPHFFTPNGDGVNDTWNITGLNDQESAKIYIFDRYGKLLKQISPKINGGWDGTFNGQPLPTTDYWFTVDYYEIDIDGTFIPKQFKAHFSLKR